MTETGKTGWDRNGLLICGVYALWFAAFAWLIFGRHFGTYLVPRLEILLIGGMVLLFVFAAVSLQGARSGLHRTTPVPWLPAAILLLPLFYLVFLGNEALGSYALAKRSIDEIGQVVGDPARVPPPATVPVRGSADSVKYMEMNDLLVHWQRHNGSWVAVKGRFCRDRRTPEGHDILFRFIIWCCAADASPTGLLVAGEPLKTIEDDDWVTVEGIFRVKVMDGNPVAYVDVKRVRKQPLPPPREQYLYY